ncbi:MAG TPA: SET domain-containing protein-lysine N-methyltransferase [Blastocatellia bacterium]|nr:SET domain-containing protein-lysine N-methyltransferase [Blastocatellia bacterium]
MGEKYAPGLTVRKSGIAGKGCFTTVPVRKRHKVAEYAGEKITQTEAMRRIQGKKIIRICGLDHRWAIDGDVGGNGTQYINHSCQPNCFTRTLHGHILFFALRDIAAGEEITCDYGDSYHERTKRCGCGAPNCRGRI